MRTVSPAAPRTGPPSWPPLWVALALLSAGCVRVSVKPAGKSFPTRVFEDTDLSALVEDVVGEPSAASSASHYTVQSSFGRSVAVQECESSRPVDHADLEHLLDRLQLRFVEAALDAEGAVCTAGPVVGTGVGDEAGECSALVTYTQAGIEGSVLLTGRPLDEGRVRLFARLEESVE